MPLPWNQIDWDQERPSVQELIASWPQVLWESVPLSDPAIANYLEAVRQTHVNGGILIGRWRAREFSEVTSWFASRSRFEEYEMLRVLFDSPAVRADLRELEIPLDLRGIHAVFAQQWAGSLTLDGVLAGILVSGGAYERFTSAREAKQIALAAVAALIGDRYEDFRVDASHDAWTPWFFNVAWDQTLVLTDSARAEVTVMCITDTD